MNTKIAIVRGLNDNRGQPMANTMPFVNYLTETEGELSVGLAKQRLWVYNGLYPEKAKIWLKGKSMIDNALYNSKGLGVHGTTPYFGFVNDELRFVAKAIQDAAKKTQPAAKLYIGRKDLGKGLNPDIRNVGIRGINGGDTLFDDVFKSYKEMNKSCFQLVFNGGTPYLSDTFVNVDCRTRFELMVKLNTMLPKNSHNGIYVFMPFEDANNPLKTPATTAAKVNDHIKYFTTLQNTAEISKDNLGVWLKNAVMHKNGVNGLTNSITPESNIELLRANPNLSTVDNWNNADQNSIQDFGITAIILIIIVCGKVLAGIIQVCKDKEPTAFDGLDNIALRAMDFAASGTDFKGIGGTGTGGGGTGDGTKSQAQKDCEAKTGYTWNDTTKTCDKDEVPPTTGGGVMAWIQENPLTSALIGGGAALALGSFGGKK